MEHSVPKAGHPSRAIGDSGCPLSIGGSGSCAPTQFFPGLIDEVSVYDRPLFAGEIKAIYQAGASGKCTGAPSCVVCPASAISWWPGEGDASDFFRANAGTIQNGTLFATGMVNQAFSFDGVSGAVQIPYASSLITTNFSLEAWVNPASQVSTQALVFGQPQGRQLLVRRGNRGLSVAFLVAKDATHLYEVDSSIEIALGEWTHLAGTYNGTNLSLYVNGGSGQAGHPRCCRLGLRLSVCNRRDYKCLQPAVRPVLPGAH